MSRKGESKIIISSSANISASHTPFTKKTHENGNNNGKSFLRWFKKNESNVRVVSSHNQNGVVGIGCGNNHIDQVLDGEDDDSSSDTLSAPHSPRVSLSSSSSQGSLYSTATTGFAFIPPDQYAPFGNATQFEKQISPGPITDTYRERIRAHEAAKEYDRRLELTLRTKYNIYSTDTLRPSEKPLHSQKGNADPLYNDRSLPNSTRTETLSPGTTSEGSSIRCRPKRNNRRTVSDSSKDRKAGAYVHVKGKRKAPSPPTNNTERNSSELSCSSHSTLSPSMSTLTRKKRQAPPPPISPSSLPTSPLSSATGLKPHSTRIMSQSAYASIQSSPPTIQSSIHQSPPTSPNGEIKTVLNGGLFDEAELEAIMNGKPLSVPASPLRKPILEQTNPSIHHQNHSTNDEGIESTDTLKLEKGILRSNRDLTITTPNQSPNKSLEVTTSPKPICTSPISPRPWYKRSSINNKDQSIPFKREITLKTMEKRKNKSAKDTSPPLPEVGYSRSSSIFDSLFTRVISSTHSHHEDHSEKRRSGIGMPNISELDREAAEIINKEKENERNRAQAANDKYYDAPPPSIEDIEQQSPSRLQERRSSTKDLINRFEESNAVKITVNTTMVVDKANKYFTDNNNETTKCNNNNTNNVNNNNNNVKKTLASKDTTTTHVVDDKNRPTSSTGSSSLSSAGQSSLASSSFSSTAQHPSIFSCRADAQTSKNIENASNDKPVQPDTRTAADNKEHNTMTTTASSSTSSSSSLSSKTWICAYCTLENYNWRVICEVCERIRPYDKMRATAPLATTEPSLLTPQRHRYAKIDDAALDKRTTTSTNVVSNVISNIKGVDSSATSTNPLNYNNKSVNNSISETSVSGVVSPNRLNYSQIKQNNEHDGAQLQKSELIDSSAVITTKPAVYVAPHPARHDQKKTSNSPDLDEMRAVRIAKFADSNKEQQEQTVELRCSTVGSSNSPEPNPRNNQNKEPLKGSEKSLNTSSKSPEYNRRSQRSPMEQMKTSTDKPLLTDRGSLEREKQRLRDMIREMNAKALEDKYPVNVNRTTKTHINLNGTAKTSEIPRASSEVRSSPSSTEVKSPNSELKRPNSEIRNPIEVGQGAIRKVFTRKSESPDNKLIADTNNFSNDDKNIKDSNKVSTPTNLPLSTRQKPPDSLLLLPSPINEVNEDDLSPASPSSHALVDQQINNIYAKLKSEPVQESAEMKSHRRNTAKGLDEFRATLKLNRNRTNTIELNKLLKELEFAIGEGEHEMAAKLAMDLALMKVSLTVTKQSRAEAAEVDTKDVNSKQDYTKVDDKKKANDSKADDTKLQVTKSDNWNASKGLNHVSSRSSDQIETNSHNNPSTKYQGNLDNTQNTVISETMTEEGATALPPSSESHSGTLSFGWTCPLCTLINSPNRLGCVACSETRPANYVVPEAYKVNETTYEMPAELIKFLNDEDNLPTTKDFMRKKDLTNNCNNLQPKNDLNRITANRKSAEIFNIIITKDEKSSTTTGTTTTTTTAITTKIPNPKTMSQTQIVMTAITESPNITKCRYRGVDNYNPHSKQVPKTVVGYKSPILVNPIVKPLRANKLPQLVGVVPKIPIVETKIELISKGLPVSINTPTTNQQTTTNLSKESNEHYTQLLNLDNSAIVSNAEAFECSICISNIAIGAGVVLRDCIHSFCRECIVNTVKYSEEAEVKCPYIDADYSCDSLIQEREIRALLSKEAYDQHLAISLKVAEHRAENAFHCRTPGCKGWCLYEDNVNQFKCPICRIVNCLTCRVVHDGLNCKQYQDRMKSDCDTNQDARRTADMLTEMIEKGEAMKCPICQVILMKKWGCDWLKCSMCKTEICWVTRGIRWGPEGKGDTSAGCKCGVNGVKCHPKCNYCH